MHAAEPIMEGAELDQMTTVELRALKDRIDTAIRAAIAKRRIEKSGVAERPMGVVDLEKDRDAWMARRSTSR
jgi:hypothetical protein